MTARIRHSGLALLTLMALACGREALAEQPIDPATLPPTQAIDAAAADRLFGDWGGLQNDLIRQGIGLKIDALTEFAGNVTGGIQRSATFANQVGFNLDINWERLAGVTGSRPMSSSSTGPAPTSAGHSATTCCRCRRSTARVATSSCISSRPMSRKP